MGQRRAHTCTHLPLCFKVPTSPCLVCVLVQATRLGAHVLASLDQGRLSTYAYLLVRSEDPNVFANCIPVKRQSGSPESIHAANLLCQFPPRWWLYDYFVGGHSSGSTSRWTSSFACMGGMPLRSCTSRCPPPLACYHAMRLGAHVLASPAKMCYSRSLNPENQGHLSTHA